VVTDPTLEIPGQLELGQALRDEGMDLVQSHNAAWTARALDELGTLAHTRPLLSADTLRDRMALLDDQPAHHNAYGAVFATAARMGMLERTDRTVESTRPDAHARRLTVWRSLVCDA
jgi:hypothetical protein